MKKSKFKSMTISEASDIFDEHDLSPETYISRFELNGDHKSFLVNILQKSQRLSYKYAHAVISTNETYKLEAIKIYPPNKEKLFIVRNEMYRYYYV